jgi:hypothetical protein
MILKIYLITCILSILAYSTSNIFGATQSSEQSLTKIQNMINKSDKKEKRILINVFHLIIRNYPISEYIMLIIFTCTPIFNLLFTFRSINSILMKFRTE